MQTEQLIPRNILFGNPAAFGAQISPDGRWLSWIAPYEGVLNIWLAPADAPSNASPLTKTKGRPIHGSVWSFDSQFVLFTLDEIGDENIHVFVVNVQTRTLRDLTPVKNAHAYPVLTSGKQLGKVIIAINDRDPAQHDYYAYDLVTAERELLWLNTQNFAALFFDWDYRPRIATLNAQDGGAIFHKIVDDTFEPWFKVDYGDILGTGPSHFSYDGKTLYFMSSVGRNTKAVVTKDWDTGEERLVAEHPLYDISEIVATQDTFEVIAASVEGQRQEWLFVAPEVQEDFDFIRQQFGRSDFVIRDMTKDRRQWIIVGYGPQRPATWYLYDRGNRKLTELFCSVPELVAYHLAAMQPYAIKSRDGMDLVSYLTLPAGIETPKPVTPLPLVLVVHGGPWSRDHYGLSAEHQWLANRGYAVLSVNYRGSNGFGKAFMAAAEKQHAAKMHDDLIDAVDWAISEGIADKDKIAITGGSYGGYASFVGVTFTPEIFCCSVPVVGITNLETLLANMPPYWHSFAEFMYRSYGDPRTEEGRQLLAERSPIHRVEQIRKPMLIFHGLNDVRCQVAESDTIVAAMQAKNIPVTYVVYPDEGHGFHKPENGIAHYAMTEAFFAKHLGGAFEPFGDDLKLSSHEIRCGGEIFEGI